MTESLLDFYRRHQISPVRQDILGSAAHFARRAALTARRILPRDLRGRTALEIGPGSGFNSLHRLAGAFALRSGRGESAWRDDIRLLFCIPPLGERIEVVSASADDYRSSVPFDFVFCEGVLALAGVPDAARLLLTVAEHTAPGGVLVITCIDAVSDFAETLRRFVAQLLIDPANDLADHVQRLLPAFASPVHAHEHEQAPR
jgi:SAM-dependent methyltransferase